jgi:enoyl-CoA hydratase/carnithine racemase
MAEAGPPALHVEGHRATITLQRPQQGNRLHREDLQALQAHLKQVAQTPGLRVLVLAATGRQFCTGFHLGELGQAEAAAQDPQAFERMVDALEALPVPTIARLQGGVYGGATDLALACDFRVGVPGLVLRMPAARLGLHYYPRGLQRYVSRLGLNAAKRLFLLAETVDAATLLQLGYLTGVAAPDALDAEVERLATLLAANAPLAVAGMKQSLDEIARCDFDLARIREREARCAASADLAEGLAAWADQRPPRFSGH